MSATVSRRFAPEDAEGPSIAGEFKQWNSDSRTGTGHFMPTAGLSMQEVDGFTNVYVEASETGFNVLTATRPFSDFNLDGGTAHVSRMSVKDTAKSGKSGFMGLTQVWKMSPEQLSQTLLDKEHTCRNPLG